MRKTWNEGRPSGAFKPTATFYLVGAIVACFLGGWVFSGQDNNPFFEYLAYSRDMSQPWTLLTYPFTAQIEHVIWFALVCWILYQFLSDLERRLEAVGVIAFFFVMTLLGGLGYTLGAAIFGQSMFPPSLNLPTEVVVFTWCLLNPSAQIKLMFVLPVPTRVLMWLCVAGIVIENGWSNPPVGFFAALPIPLAWLYVTNRVPGLKFGAVASVGEVKAKRKNDQEFRDFMGKVKEREKDREEKERLRKLFESSLSDDDDKKD